MSEETGEPSFFYSSNGDEGDYNENPNWKGEWGFEVGEGYEGYDELLEVEQSNEGDELSLVHLSPTPTGSISQKVAKAPPTVDTLSSRQTDEAEDTETVELQEAIRRTKHLKSQRMKLMRRRENGWRKLIEMYKNNTVSFDISETDDAEDEVQTRYQNMLMEFKRKKTEALERIHKITEYLETIRSSIETKQKECDSLEAEQYDLELKTGVGMKNSKTGKSLTHNEVVHTLNVYRSKVNDLSKHRLEYIIKKNKCNEVLADIEKLGVDEYLRKYETLESKNRDYENKIEDKRNEIVKYRDRNISLVHKISHIRLKSTSMEDDVKTQLDVLQQLDRNLNEVRRQNYDIRRRKEKDRQRLLNAQRLVLLARVPKMDFKYTEQLSSEESAMMITAQRPFVSTLSHRYDFVSGNYETKILRSVSDRDEPYSSQRVEGGRAEQETGRDHVAL